MRDWKGGRGRGGGFYWGTKVIDQGIQNKNDILLTIEEEKQIKFAINSRIRV